jgi:hypothetical protein
MRKIGIIILLVLCLTLLLLTGCVVNTVIPETTMGNLGNQENTEEPVIENTEEPVIENTEEPVIENTEEPVIENTEEPQKWSGLGMGIFSNDDIDIFNGWVDDLIANGFTQIREIVIYQDTAWLARSKTCMLSAIAKGMNVIWGVSSYNTINPDYTITAENWSTYRQAILDAAQWAEDNGVYEFQLGNEEEIHVDWKTMIPDQLITNLKSVATDVQAIFTNGNISYTCESSLISDWITAGKGDIDIIASNIYMYMGGTTFNDDWKTKITDLVNVFGSDGTYITEFNLNYTSLDDYSTDEAVQAAGITEMIEYIKASGIERAIFFCFKNDDFGVVKADDTYRLLWNQALLNSGSVKFATVPTKTTTASLPDAIAHLYQE